MVSDAVIKTERGLGKGTNNALIRSVHRDIVNLMTKNHRNLSRWKGPRILHVFSLLSQFFEQEPSENGQAFPVKISFGAFSIEQGAG